MYARPHDDLEEESVSDFSHAGSAETTWSFSSWCFSWVAWRTCPAFFFDRSVLRVGVANGTTVVLHGSTEVD